MVLPLILLMTWRKVSFISWAGNCRGPDICLHRTARQHVPARVYHNWKASRSKTLCSYTVSTPVDIMLGCLTFLQAWVTPLRVAAVLRTCAHDLVLAATWAPAQSLSIHCR